jgi:hypothetical protein
MDDSVERTTSIPRTAVRRGDLVITGWHRDAARFLAGCIGTGALLGAAVAAARGPHG